MKKEIIATTALAGLGIAALALASKNKPLETVSHVDLENTWVNGMKYRLFRKALKEAAPAPLPNIV